MPSITTTDPAHDFDALRLRAHREPVEITRDGRRDMVLLSADQYDWLRAAAQRTHRTSSAPQVVIEAVERATMDLEHANLDRLLD